MLQVIFFYIFIWWFRKSENKKELTARSVIAAIIGTFFLIAGIVMFTGTSTVPEEDSWGFIFGGILFIILAGLFLIRAIVDIEKILRLKTEEEEKRHEAKPCLPKAEQDASEEVVVFDRTGKYEEERQRAIAKSDEARKRREAEEARKQKAEQDIATCKTLLEECGMQFFIEYYPQLKRLPIPDITVSDHYFPERLVRLTAAKKIVDLGLTECALHYIIEKFGDVFSEEVIGRAKILLDEIENEKGEIK